MKSPGMDNQSKGVQKLVGRMLKEICENSKIEINYFAICVMALKLLDEVFGEEKYDFPINIEKLLNEVGLEVIYQPLNNINNREDRRAHRIVGKILKKKNRVTSNKINVILIDSESCEEEQRYTLAHELAHYLIHIEDEDYMSEYRIMPMLFKEKEEIIADIFAIFLLIPLPIFLKEFSHYIGDGEVPIKTSEWLSYLGTVAVVPYEEVAIGYQNLRYVSCVVYKEEKENGIDAIFNEEVNIPQENSNLHKKDIKEITDVMKKYYKKLNMLTKLTEIKKLFC